MCCIFNFIYEKPFRDHFFSQSQCEWMSVLLAIVELQLRRDIFYDDDDDW